MDQGKEVVLLTGASGSMGFEAFRLLWEKRDKYEIVLLLRPSRKNKRRFRPYEQESGIKPVRGAGTVTGRGLKIVWGDVLECGDVEEACRGIDWCLHPLALISPEADRDPDRTYRINVEGTRHLVEAIEAQDPERIRMIYIGSVAMYGHRSPPFHVGRTGDPLLPSAYDHYAISKVKGERVVMESTIRHKASLRQTFIMIPRLFSLMDPIMFHQPLDSFMENITSRDSGRLLVNCLEIPGESDFWGGFYNISGGEGCRATFVEFLDRIYSLLGIDYRRVTERNWFALKNFHMIFFEDAHILNSYLYHWEGGESLEDYYRRVWEAFPWYLKLVARLNRQLPPFRWMVQRITYLQMKRLVSRPEATLGWIREGNQGRMESFFGGMERFRAIPGWDGTMPSLDHHQEYKRLDHGYDESREELALEDLKRAADFRGGALLSSEWDGDLHLPLSWKCCRGHHFELTPHSVLKGGHWCTECITESWNCTGKDDLNRFASQVYLSADSPVSSPVESPAS